MTKTHKKRISLSYSESIWKVWSILDSFTKKGVFLILIFHPNDQPVVWEIALERGKIFSTGWWFRLKVQWKVDDDTSRPFKLQREYKRVTPPNGFRPIRVSDIKRFELVVSPGRSGRRSSLWWKLWLRLFEKTPSQLIYNCCYLLSKCLMFENLMTVEMIWSDSGITEIYQYLDWKIWIFTFIAWF